MPSYLERIETFLKRKGTLATILVVLISFFACLFFLNHYVRPHPGGKKTYKVWQNASGNSLRFSEDSSTTPTVDNAWAGSTTATGGGDAAKARNVLPKPIGIGDYTYNQNPNLLLWIMAMSMMFATAGGLLFPVGSRLLHIAKDNTLSKATVWAYFISSVVIGFIVARVTNGSYLDEFRLMSLREIIDHFQVLLNNFEPVNWLIYLTYIPGVLAVFGMLLVNAYIERLPDAGPANQEELLVTFGWLHTDLKFFLGAFSVLIAYSVLTTTLLKNSIDAVVILNQFELFPVSLIYAYGLTFTIVLAVLYILIF